MKSPSKIMLITKEDATAEMVSSVVNSSRNMVLAGICHGLSELRGHLEHTQITAVLVDIDEDPSGILDDLHVITTTYPETRFVVVSAQFLNELVLEAMHAGARHFLLKESITSKLDEVLQRLVLDSTKKKEASLGSVISVFSASGGCGASTIVLNLANELRLVSSMPVLAIDLDCNYGTIASYLGITAQYGIADVLAHKGPIDKNLVRTSACNYMEDFHVLVSPASIADPKHKQPQYKNLTDVLQTCRQAYKYTVVDAPRASEGVAIDLAAASKIILIVFQLTVKDIKTVQSMVSSLTKCGVAPQKIVPLVNRFKKRGPLVRLEDGEKVLGFAHVPHIHSNLRNIVQSLVSFLTKRGVSAERLMPLVNRFMRQDPLVKFEDGEKAVGFVSIPRIRSDFRNALNSLNLGEPLAETAPWSGLRKDFQKLAAQIYACETNGKGKGLK